MEKLSGKLLLKCLDTPHCKENQLLVVKHVVRDCDVFVSLPSFATAYSQSSLLPEVNEARVNRLVVMTPNGVTRGQSLKCCRLQLAS